MLRSSFSCCPHPYLCARLRSLFPLRGTSQHHVCNVAEEMITDALTAAKGVPFVRGEFGADGAARAFDLVGACDEPAAWVDDALEVGYAPQPWRSWQLCYRAGALCL